MSLKNKLCMVWLAGLTIGIATDPHIHIPHNFWISLTATFVSAVAGCTIVYLQVQERKKVNHWTNY